LDVILETKMLNLHAMHLLSSWALSCRLWKL